MSNTLYIPNINIINPIDLENMGLPYHLTKMVRLNYWRITNIALFEGQEKDRYLDVPMYQPYTVTNISFWEYNQLNYWFLNKSKKYHNLFIYGPEYFVDLDLDDWQNACCGMAIPRDIEDEFCSFLASLPPATHFIQLNDRNLDNELEDIFNFLKNNCSSNYKVMLGPSYNFLFTEEKDAAFFKLTWG